MTDDLRGSNLARYKDSSSMNLDIEPTFIPCR